MSRSQKPRKAYRPREARIDIPALMFESDEPICEQSRSSILIALHGSMAAMAKGEAVHNDWHSIVNCLNVMQILCERSGNKMIGLAVVYSAQNAMINIAERYKAKGVLRFGRGEMATVNEATTLYEDFLSTVTKRQYTSAIREVDKRMKNGNVVRIRATGTKRMGIPKNNEARTA